MKRLLILVICVLLINGYTLMAQSNSKSNKLEQKTASVIYVLTKGRKANNNKYLYEDLLKGMRSKGYKTTIDFVSPAKAEATIFADYDVVIAVSERSTGKLSADIASFVAVNKTQKNLMAIAFDRRGSRFPPLEGVDIISSASNEDRAARFVKNEVSAQVVDLLKK